MRFEQLHAWDNLLLAYHRAAKGKRGRPSVAAFDLRLEENLTKLEDELRTGRYRPGPYHSFFIHEPKRRLISAAPFRDRVVHHALCQIIEPAFERSFVVESFANRVGLGTHRALRQVQALARRFPYVLAGDIRQFFPSIDHAVLREILARKIRDPGLLRLVEQILASGVGVLSEEYEMVYFAGDDLFARARPRGLPIGNLTSQFWANCYLNPFDHFVKRELRCPGYVRYVDDFLLFAESRAQLGQWKGQLVERLAALRLTMHPGAHPRPVTEGIPFLGFVTYPNHRRLKSRKGLYYRRKLRHWAALHAVGQREIADITASVQGWVNHLRFANTVGLRKAILREMVFRRRKT